MAGTGGAGTLIVAATAHRNRVVLFGDESMTGTAYFGPPGAVNNVNKIGQPRKLSMWPKTYMEQSMEWTAMRRKLWVVTSLLGLVAGGIPTVIFAQGGTSYYPVPDTNVPTTAFGRSWILQPPAVAMTYLGLSSWMQDRVTEPNDAAWATDANSPVYNVKHYRATGDGVTDDTEALRLTLAKAMVTGTSGTYGGAYSGTYRTMYLPHGVYRITGYISPDTPQAVNYLNIVGDNATILCDSNDITVFGGLGYNVRISGIIVRHGDKAISVRTNNVNSATVYVDHCEFHDPNTFAVGTDTNSASTLLVVQNCKFRLRHGDNGGWAGYFPTGDCVVFRDCWIESRHRRVFYAGGALYLRDILGVPGGDLVAGGGAWVENHYAVDIEGFRMGGESGGADALVVNEATTDASVPVIPTRVAVRNSPAYAGTHLFVFNELPNLIQARDLYGLSSAYFRGWDFNDVTISVSDLIDFQRWGHVDVAKNYMQQWTTYSDDGGSSAATAQMLMWTKALRHGDASSPAPDRWDCNDVLGSSGWTTGWTNSGDLTGVYVTDRYGVQQRQWTADAVAGREASYDNDALDYASLVYGQPYTWAMRYDVNDVNAPALVAVDVGGGEPVWHSLTADGWIVYPFVWLNAAGGPQTITDRVYITTQLQQAGDAIRLGRMVLLKGAYHELSDPVLVTHGAVAPTVIGTALYNTQGRYSGDIHYRTDPAAGDVLLDACTAAGNPGTWATLTLDP